MLYKNRQECAPAIELVYRTLKGDRPTVGYFGVAKKEEEACTLSVCYIVSHSTRDREYGLGCDG
jgi:hypothetical protein